MVYVIIPCKNRLEHLKQTLPKLLLARGEWKAIVVDYNCPEKTYLFVNNQIRSERVVAYQALVHAHEWSLSAARNSGFLFAERWMFLEPNDIVFFMDADNILEADFFERNVPHLVAGSFLCGWNYGDATGSCMMYARDFQNINGYNEELKSWGFEDIDLYQRLQTKFSMEMRAWQGGISTIKHGDEIRNTFHGNKHPLDTNNENLEIAKTKFKGLYDLGTN